MKAIFFAILTLACAIPVRAAPCNDREYHALDFWIGDWDVQDPRNGKLVGTSSIQSILGGCGVLENWTGRDGMTGKSFNTLDRPSNRWKQTWVDSDGESYDFAGEASPDRMVYVRDFEKDGKRMRNRMTLSRLADGTVDQLSQISADGTTWSIEYDFHYVKHGNAASPAGQQFAPVQGTAFASDATVLRVGDPRVDATKIQPYRAKWRETFVTPLNQVVVTGTWTDQVERIVIDGRTVLKRTVAVDRPERNIHSVTTLLVDGRSFAPMTTEEVHDGKPADLHFDFSGAHVTGKRQEHPVDAATSEAAFDTLGGMTDLFPAALPLRAGFAARFPNFSATAGPESDPSSITWLMLQVKRQDTIALPDGRRAKAWLVDSDTPVGFYKVWIADEPPYIVRTIWMGPGGGRSTFDLISMN